jgi:hypothetical protein
MAEATSVFFMNPPVKVEQAWIDVRRRKSRPAVQLRCQQITACFAGTFSHSERIGDDGMATKHGALRNARAGAFSTLTVTFA